MYKPRTLIPKECFLYCNHSTKTISDGVYLGINADASEWVEITVEEAEALKMQWESETEEI